MKCAVLQGEDLAAVHEALRDPAVLHAPEESLQRARLECKHTREAEREGSDVAWFERKGIHLVNRKSKSDVNFLVKSSQEEEKIPLEKVSETQGKE